MKQKITERFNVEDISDLKLIPKEIYFRDEEYVGLPAKYQFLKKKDCPPDPEEIWPGFEKKLKFD